MTDRSRNTTNTTIHDTIQCNATTIQYTIDPMQKWLPLNYSFVHIQNSLTNLARDNKFFSYFCIGSIQYTFFCISLLFVTFLKITRSIKTPDQEFNSEDRSLFLMTKFYFLPGEYYSCSLNDLGVALEEQ